MVQNVLKASDGTEHVDQEKRMRLPLVYGVLGSRRHPPDSIVVLVNASGVMTLKLLPHQVFRTGTGTGCLGNRAITSGALPQQWPLATVPRDEKPFNNRLDLPKADCARLTDGNMVWSRGVNMSFLSLVDL